MTHDDDDDQMFFISQPNSSFYTQSVSQEGESRCRRRRKKEKVVEETMENIGFRKRKLTDEQVKILEENFGNEHKLESERKDRIAAELGLDPRQVAVWFQNRRVRWKTKKIEMEYSKLKSEHESVIVEKTCLESEVLKLKKQLIEAEKKIQKLSEERAVSNGSPNSSFSMDNYNQDFVGEFGVMNNGFENLLYDQEYYVQEMEMEMEWVNNLQYGL